MRTLLIAYDLNSPGQDYKQLTEQLKSYTRWWHHLDSTWLINTTKSVTEVRDELKPYLDSGDELLVVEVHRSAYAWIGFRGRAGDWIREHFRQL